MGTRINLVNEDQPWERESAVRTRIPVCSHGTHCSYPSKVAQDKVGQSVWCGHAACMGRDPQLLLGTREIGLCLLSHPKDVSTEPAMHDIGVRP